MIKNILIWFFCPGHNGKKNLIAYLVWISISMSIIFDENLLNLLLEFKFISYCINKAVLFLFANIIKNIGYSILAAVIFYFFIEHLKVVKHRKNNLFFINQSKNVLNVFNNNKNINNNLGQFTGNGYNQTNLIKSNHVNYVAFQNEYPGDYQYIEILIKQIKLINKDYFNNEELDYYNKILSNFIICIFEKESLCYPQTTINNSFVSLNENIDILQKLLEKNIFFNLDIKKEVKIKLKEVAHILLDDLSLENKDINFSKNNEKLYEIIKKINNRKYNALSIDFTASDSPIIYSGGVIYYKNIIYSKISINSCKKEIVLLYE